MQYYIMPSIIINVHHKYIRFQYCSQCKRYKSFDNFESRYTNTCLDCLNSYKDAYEST